MLKNAASAVNTAKQEIDDAKVRTYPNVLCLCSLLQAVIDRKKQERMSKPEFSEGLGGDEEAEIIDEEEFEAISKLREAKKQYRDAYDVVCIVAYVVVGNGVTVEITTN